MRINLLGVIVSAIIIVLLRYLWYSHFGGADWGHLVGKAVAAIQADQKVALKELVNALVLSLGLGWLCSQTGGRSLVGGIGAGIAAGLFFALTTASDGFIHGAPLMSALIDGGYLMLAYVLGGAIVGGLAPRRSRTSAFNWAAAPAAPAAADHGHHAAADHGHGGHH